MSNEPINSELSREQLETELKRVQKRHDRSSAIKKAALWMLCSIALLATVSVLWFPVLWIMDASVGNSEGGCAVLTMRMQKLQYEDIVACNRGDDSVILQVVAMAGDSIDYHSQGFISVNGNKQYAAKYVSDVSIVPDDCMLLMNSSGKEVFCVQREEIIGKVILRIWPFPWIVYT